MKVKRRCNPSRRTASTKGNIADNAHNVQATLCSFPSGLFPLTAVRERLRFGTRRSPKEDGVRCGRNDLKLEVLKVFKPARYTLSLIQTEARVSPGAIVH